MSRRIVVIGGGAAGMLAAAVAAEKGARVLLLERNEIMGKKLRITGKGRCNLTNDCTVSEVLDNIPTGSLFLQSAVNRFGPGDTIRLFESLGVALKRERGGRVFPQSDKASDITDALCRYMDKAGVERKHARATDLVTENGRITEVLTRHDRITCDAVILATGGISYPATGSTGDGYKMASSLGHSIMPLSGSLVPLVAEPDVCSGMQGLTLKNVHVSVYDGGAKPIFDDFGEILFTHFGVSGPLALSASAHLRDYINKKYYLSIDLKPALDDKKLDARILRDFEANANRDFINSLGGLLSKLMIPVVVDRSGIPPRTKTHSITREQRMKLIQVVKSFKINIEGPRPVEEAVITSGGVKLSEINPKTMESKLVSGLFFAGEVIDADAYTGGFNLQIAWSTACAAASGAAFCV